MTSNPAADLVVAAVVVGSGAVSADLAAAVSGVAARVGVGDRVEKCSLEILG